MREVAIPVQAHHLGIQEVQWGNCVGPAGTSGLLKDKVPAVGQLTEVELHGSLTTLNLYRKEAREDHRHLSRGRPKEAQGAQCAEADHSIKRMKACLELDSATLDGGCIEEEGEDSGSDHALHNQGVESPKGTSTTLDQS